MALWHKQEWCCQNDVGNSNKCHWHTVSSDGKETHVLQVGIVRVAVHEQTNDDEIGGSSNKGTNLQKLIEILEDRCGR